MPNTVTITPDAEKVAALFVAARDLIRPDVPAGRVIGLPSVTEAGLETVATVLNSRLEISVPVGRLLYRGACIPAVSRRRRVLSALAKWLPGAPSYYVFENETWFNGRIVQEIAASSAGAATEADAAGLLALMILTPRIETERSGENL